MYCQLCRLCNRYKTLPQYIDAHFGGCFVTYRFIAKTVQAARQLEPRRWTVQGMASSLESSKPFVQPESYSAKNEIIAYRNAQPHFGADFRRWVWIAFILSRYPCALDIFTTFWKKNSVASGLAADGPGCSSCRQQRNKKQLRWRIFNQPMCHNIGCLYRSILKNSHTRHLKRWHLEVSPKAQWVEVAALVVQ